LSILLSWMAELNSSLSILLSWMAEF